MLVYNTQLHKKVELTPIEPGKIRMHVCGPTVYDQIHVGNGRTFLAFDVIRSALSISIPMILISSYSGIRLFRSLDATWTTSSF